MAGVWVVTAAVTVLLARVPGVSGSEYLLAFVGSARDVTEQSSVTVTCSGDNVSAELTSRSFGFQYSVEWSAAAGGTTVLLNSSHRMTTLGKNSLALRLKIQGGNESTVYGASDQQAGSDAFLARPSSSLGTQYVAITATPAAPGFSFLVIVAAKDSTNGTDATNASDATNATSNTTSNTTVQVQALWGEKSMTFSDVTFKDLRTVNFTLETYEAFLVTSPQDLSATHVISDKPVAVFSGNVDGQGRVMVEQLPPVTAWGIDHVTIPSPNAVGNAKDMYRVVCSADATTLTINGNKSYDMEYAGRMENLMLNASRLHFITANKPIQVVKVLESKDANQGSCLSLVVPVQQWRTSYIFTSTLGALLSVAVEDQFNNSLLLNQSDLSVDPWVPVPNSFLVAGSLSLDPGTYVLSSKEANVTFGAHLTVTASNRSSCHPVDMEMQHINMNYTTFRKSVLPTCNQSITTTAIPRTEVVHLPTQEELGLIVADTVANLTVNKQTLSASVRRKISMPDPRPSSTSIGAVGIIIIAIVPIVIIALDLPKLVRDCRYARNSVRKFRQRRKRPGPEVIVVKEFPY